VKESTGLYSEEIADQILEHIENGGTIASACKLDGMPSASTLRRWRRGKGQGVSEDFGERFEKALTIRLEGFVDDLLLQLPRDIDPDHPGELQKARLECENRRWLLSKMLRDKFGERTGVDIGGQKANPLDLGRGSRLRLRSVSAVRGLGEQSPNDELRRLRIESDPPQGRSARPAQSGQGRRPSPHWIMRRGSLKSPPGRG
jgi:transposase-like protein